MSTGGEELVAGVKSDAGELNRSRRSQSPEVSVSGHVVSSDCAVEGSGNDEFPVVTEQYSRHGRRVLVECDGAESGRRVPQLYFPVISARHYVLAVWTVRQTIHVRAVTLLLHRVTLALPFPYQQLTQTRTTQRYPVTRVVQGYRIDRLL